MTYKYDVALSFAGENRDFAKAVATMLRSQNIEVFYDEFSTAELWGENLSVKFREVYSTDSRYCIIFFSDYYLEKVWAVVELRNAIEKNILERGEAYILPVRLDGFSGDVPGLPNTIGYISAISAEPEEVVWRFLQKIHTTKKNQTVITVELIQEEVSKFFDLTLRELKSDQKQKKISEPRQIAMFLCRKYTSCSFPEIGREFGGKNHSTVIHAVKNIEKKIRENVYISNVVSRISLQVENSNQRKL